MRFQDAKLQINALGMSLLRSNVEGEFRVAFRGPDQEASAYYTTDLDDAVGTAATMAEKAPADTRLFIGVFPTGLSYADRTKERDGDYKRLAFLSFHTLELEVERDCPADLRARIEADALKLQNRRGEQFQVSTCNQTVRLGG